MISFQKRSWAQEEQYHINMTGSIWFKRFYRESKRISPYIRFKRIKYGFYRIYYKGAYLHEVYSEMPMIGYDIEDYDPRLENKSYFEEYEDSAELTRKIKNFVEGYFDSIDKIRTRVWMFENDKEFNKTSSNAYQSVVIK